MANDAQILITCTTRFKNAVGEYAQQHNVSVALLIRDAVAKYIKYDFDEEKTTDRRRKYASAEDRKEAQRQRQKQERAEVNKLLALLKHEQHVESVQAIRNSLERKGVTIDD